MVFRSVNDAGGPSAVALRRADHHCSSQHSNHIPPHIPIIAPHPIPPRPRNQQLPLLKIPQTDSIQFQTSLLQNLLAKSKMAHHSHCVWRDLNAGADLSPFILNTALYFGMEGSCWGRGGGLPVVSQALFPGRALRVLLCGRISRMRDRLDVERLSLCSGEEMRGVVDSSPRPHPTTTTLRG